MQDQPTTPALIQAALEYITPNLARDEWARVGMAIKSEFPDSEGFTLFDDWSQGGEHYDPASVKSTWQSIKPGGGVAIGTLLQMAKAGGFDVAAQRRALNLTSAPQPARRPTAKGQATQDDQQRQQGHEHAASEAAKLWEGAIEAGEAPYLVRKGVKPYGVRMASDGYLLVPLRDATGKLWNVQRIAPNKPAKGGSDKLFCKGGRKAGLFHLMGDAASTGPVLIAEGYATGASLHEATGQPVAVAFDAGNLRTVALALRERYPLALLVVCGDDDQQTHAKIGSNPGRDKATAAATSVGGVAVFPESLPPGESDFNDMHQRAGLEAVAVLVNAAIAAVPPTPPKPAPASETDQAQPNLSPNAKKPASGSLDRFSVEDGGVWFNGIDQEGKPKPPEWVCSRLDVTAKTVEQDGNEWGYLLAFLDSLGKPKQWAMPARMLAGDGGEYRTVLLSMGLRIGTSSRARNLLTQYIQTRDPGEYATCTAKIGWHGDAYVLPHKTIGESAGRVIYQTEAGGNNSFSEKKNVEAWKAKVAHFCAGNSRLVFSVACAFAGPLLQPAGVESGGFNLGGDSSSGKTTSLRVAASVYGSHSYLQRWKTTDNALEAIAAQHNDCLLVLDELAQVDPKIVGDCVYMLANEQGKGRATRGGTLRASHTWRLLFLSTGEMTLAAHMADGMKQAKAGQEVRMADIPSDAGAGIGGLETLHGLETGAAFAEQMLKATESAYGAVGIAWLEYLCDWKKEPKGSLKGALDAFMLELVPKGAHGQVARVGKRFALVAVAGEMATAAGLTGWAKGESEAAVMACFKDWLKARGGDGNSEVKAMLHAVKRFIEQGGEGRFSQVSRSADDHAPSVQNRAGFRRLVDETGAPLGSSGRKLTDIAASRGTEDHDNYKTEYLLLPDVFRVEVCKGYNHLSVCKVLLEHGLLLPDKGRPYDYTARIPGVGKIKCYRIPPAILELDI